MKCSRNLTLLQIEFQIRLQSFEPKIENKKYLRKQKYSINQERHLTLEMSTSRTARVERERESTHTKQHQDKV
jgi:hypothetical protein